MEFKQHVIRGVRWASFSTVVLSITQLITTAVLARFLAKTDFGIMAIIIVVRGFAELFMDFGITVAILHKQNISQKEYSSLYWANMIIGFIIYALLWIVTPLISAFYNEVELLKLIPLMCLAIPLSSIGRQQKTILQKELYFQDIAIVDIVSAILSFGIAMYLAVNAWGIYALIYSNLSRYVVANIIYYFIGVRKMPIKLHFSIQEVVPFFKIGMYNTGGQVVNYFSSSFDILIIGKLLGADALGIYNLAKELVLKPSAILSPIIARVMTPLFAKIQNKQDYLLESFFLIQKIVANVNVYIYIGIALFSSPIVKLYYGENYEKCIPIVTLLAIYYMFREYAQPMSMVCTAKGRTDIDMWWNVFVLMTFPLFVYVSALFSIEIVAIILVIYILLSLYPGWYIYSRRILNVKFVEYYKALFDSLKLIMLPAFIVIILNHYFDSQMLLVLLLGGFIYTILVGGMILKYERNLLFIVLQIFKK